MTQFLSIPRVAVVTTLPAAADHPNGLVAQGGDLYYSDGTSWTQVDASSASLPGTAGQVLLSDGSGGAATSALEVVAAGVGWAGDWLRVPGTGTGDEGYLQIAAPTSIPNQQPQAYLYVSSFNVSAGQMRFNGSDVLTTADEGSGNGLDADLLDGQHGSYYLDWGNFTSTPTTVAGYGITDALTDADLATAGGVVVNRVNASTGAVQADDDGDARGSYAVDLQTSRAASTQVASGDNSTVSGGYSNTASGFIGSTVSGGYSNTASGDRATVSGGHGNVASGLTSTVCGGFTNTASGDYSFAAGRQSKATHDGSFVLSDSQVADHNSSSTDRLHLRFQNGIEVNGTALGDAIYADIGTSGDAVGKLNTANTWSGAQTLSFDNPYIELDDTAGGLQRDYRLWNSGGTFQIYDVTNAAARLTVNSTGINSTAIGATTPSTGAFTTLSATDNVTVTRTTEGRVLVSSAAATVGESAFTYYQSNRGRVGYNGATSRIELSDKNTNGTSTNKIIALSSTGVDRLIVGSTGVTVTGDISATESILADKVNGFIDTDVAMSTARAGIKVYGVTECAVLKLPAYTASTMMVVRIRGASYNASPGIVDVSVRFFMDSSTAMNTVTAQAEILHHGSATPPVRIGYDSGLGRHYIAIGDDSSSANHASLSSSGTMHFAYTVAEVLSYFNNGDNPDMHAGFEWTTATNAAVSAYTQVLTPTTRTTTIT